MLWRFTWGLPGCCLPSSPGANQLEAALSGADLTITTAGMPRRPGMTREQLFDINAAVVKSVAEAAARVGV